VRILEALFAATGVGPSQTHAARKASYATLHTYDGDFVTYAASPGAPSRCSGSGACWVD
jgi:hypothetical protein